MQKDGVKMFEKIESFYRDEISLDYNQGYKQATQTYHGEDFTKLPQDYQDVINKYSQFRMGNYTFGVFEKLDCKLLGRFIIVAYCYIGGGLYHNWVYYIDGGYFGKRIDDSPTRNAKVYTNFTEMMEDFWKNKSKYDVRNNTIKYQNLSLPF